MVTVDKTGENPSGGETIAAAPRPDRRDWQAMQASHLHSVAWALIALALVMLLVDLLAGPLLNGGRLFGAAVLLGLAGDVGLVLGYRQQIVTGSRVLVLLTLASYLLLTLWPPPFLPGSLVYLGIVVLVAGLLLDRLWILPLSLVAIAALFVPLLYTTGAIEAAGSASTLTTIILTIAGVAVLGFLVYLLFDRLQRLEKRNQSLKLTLEETQTRLQRQIEDRTEALTLAARVGRQITRVRDQDTLLQEAVDLIRDRFDLYYVQVYLRNPARNELVLHAGTGEVGRELKQWGHRLPVGPGSINGTAALTRRPIAVAFARESPIFLPNLLLPETQSELAVPMIFENEVIGVLNLQSVVPGSLGEEAVDAFMALAAQLAVAVANARLFDEISRTREELARQTKVLTRTGWDKFLASSPAGAVWESGSDGSSEPVDRLLQPIDIRGTTIGQLEIGIDAPDSSQQARRLVGAIAGQLGAHLENLRLTQQAEIALEEARRRGEELELINHVVTAVAASTKLQDSLQIIVDQLAVATSIKQIGIALLNEDKTRLTVVADRSERLRSPSAVGVVIPLANNPASQMAIRDKRTVIVENATENPLTASAHDVLRQRGVRSIVILPLVVENEVIGTVGLDVVEEGVQLSENQLRLAETIVYQAAAAVQRARLFDQTQTALKNQARLSAELRTVSEVSVVTAATLETDRLLTAAANLTKESFDLYHAHIYLLDETNDTLVLRAGAGEIGRRMVEEGRKIPLTGNSIVARAARERDVVNVNDTRVSPDFLPHPLLPDTRSELAVPMIAGERPLGVLDVQADKAGRFQPEDVQVYKILAAQLAVAIQNAYFFTEQLNTAEKLREVDRLKTDFLARMSHELRTPLNSIIGFADVLLMGLDGELTERMMEDLQLIRSSGYHLRDIIGDILDMSKIEAGRLELNYETFDIHRVAAELMATASPLAEQKGLNLELSIADDVSSLSADRTRIRQVLWNIVGNAIKYTDHGDVHVYVQRNNGEVTFVVTDTGVGIPPEELPRIFEQFRQVELPSRGSIGGTGLGLSISKSLIEMHGGRIWVESQPGKGSLFGFSLPSGTREKV